MKNTILTVTALFATAIFAPALHAQPAIDWFTVDGGGGTSAGGAYTVTGTIGQPDAGLMTGECYALVGGFWGVTAPAQSPAPALTITPSSNGSVIVCWPSCATGYVLQQTSSLLSPDWVNVSQGPSDNGMTKCVTISRANGNLFFRLRK